VYILKNKIGYSKRKILSCLIIISLISLGLKLYTVDFSSLPPEDVFGYTLRAFSHNNGDFTEPERKTLGWSLTISPFFKLVDSDHFLDYVNVVRILSLSISTISIFPMYLLARRFTNEKYSLVAAFLFAIEPHLNHNAGLGLSEPLFVLAMMLSIYFVLTKDTRLLCISFLLAGAMWWIRFNGIVMLPILLLILILNSKRSSRVIPVILLCISLFLIVISPMLIHRYMQYGDPLYFSQSDTLYTGEFVTVVAENTKGESYSALDYITDHGMEQFIWKFIVGGFYNLGDQVIKLLYPYLIVLLPMGIFFSFRAFDQNPNHIKANWIVILITLGSFVSYFAVIQERRLIFHLIPFFIIFAIIPIQRLIEYGLSTFSFSQKQKNYSLIIVLSVTLILAVTFTLRYDLPDATKEQEKIELAKYLLSNHEGKILDAGNALEGLIYAKIESSPNNFKNYMIKNDLDATNEKIKPISLYAKSMTDFINIAEQYDLKYVIINRDEITTVWYPFFENVYDSESSYQYLVKITDSTQLGFEKLNVKVFQIDYNKFHELNN
jgi:hypothetical protein